jgi:hypothetical protein
MNTNLSTLNPVSYKLFDKIINIALIHDDGSSDRIICPATGRKPTIRLKGTLYSQTDLLQIELRLTNLYVPQPLSVYKSIRVTAGYSGGLQYAFTGSIHLAFQELPGPDGVTVFQLLLGNLATWRETFVSTVYFAGQQLRDVLSELAVEMGLTLTYDADAGLALPVDVPWNSYAKDLISHLKDLFSRYDPQTGVKTGIEICPIGDKLICYAGNKGRAGQTIWKPDFISHARSQASGFEIQGPWIPQLLPGDLIYVDPKFFKQDFGGAAVGHGNTFVVYLIDFDFGTTDDTNSMSLMTLGAA